MRRLLRFIRRPDLESGLRVLDHGPLRNTEELDRDPDIAHGADRVDGEAKVGKELEQALCVQKSEYEVQYEEGGQGHEDEVIAGDRARKGDVNKRGLEPEERLMPEKCGDRAVNALMQADDNDDRGKEPANESRPQAEIHLQKRVHDTGENSHENAYPVNCFSRQSKFADLFQ